MKWARGTEQWASSKNSKLMRLFFFSIGRAFRAANWPWITLSRAENYAPRNDYNGSFKIFDSFALFNGKRGGGRPFSFEPSPRRGHFSWIVSWMETWFSRSPFVRRKNLLTCVEIGSRLREKVILTVSFFFSLSFFVQKNRERNVSTNFR